MGTLMLGSSGNFAAAGGGTAETAALSPLVTPGGNQDDGGDDGDGDGDGDSERAMVPATRSGDGAVTKVIDYVTLLGALLPYTSQVGSV
jgi:hypothetical protein